MSAVQPHIPTEIYLGLSGTNDPDSLELPRHPDGRDLVRAGSDLHLTIRFGKPKPTLNGIQEKVSIWHAAWWWFSVHKYGLMVAIGLALAGAIVALWSGAALAARCTRSSELPRSLWDVCRSPGAGSGEPTAAETTTRPIRTIPRPGVGDHYDMTPAPADFRGLSQDRRLFRLLLRCRRGRYGRDAISDAGTGGIHHRRRACRVRAVHRAGVQRAALRRLPCGARLQSRASLQQSARKSVTQHRAVA